MEQYIVDLCESIYISEITKMMTILEYTKDSNNLHCNLGEENNKGGFLIKS